MSSVVISGDTSGSVTLQAPATAGSTVLTLPATSGTVLTTASGQWITTGSDIYYNTGNVGIGTSSPAQKLTLGAAGVARFYRSDNSRYGDIYADNNGFNIVSASNSDQLYLTAVGTGSSIILSTVNTVRMTIDSSGYVTNGANGNSAGLVQGYQYYRLNSGYTGTQATTAQSLFGVGVTLVGSTVYEFEMVIALAKTAGTTSHTASLGFGGTATVNNISYNWTANQMDGGFTTVNNAVSNYFIQTASATVVTAAQTSATRYWYGVLKGTVSINAGGTFIPQYTLSAAPGGAYTTQIGSYIKIAPLSASGSNTSIGAWA